MSTTTPTITPTTMLLTCYADTYGYGWHHVDLFVHDEDGRELPVGGAAPGPEKE